LIVNDKGRNRTYPSINAISNFITCALDQRARLEEGKRCLDTLEQASFGSHPSEFVSAADIDTLGEVCVEEPLLHLMLQGGTTLSERVADQTMGIKGIGALGDVHSKGDAVLGCGLRDPVDDFRCPVGPSELLGVTNGNRRWRRRRSGVELIRPPNYFDALAFLRRQHRNSFVEPRLPDCAPRTHNIGVDLDEHEPDGSCVHPPRLYFLVSGSLTLVGSTCGPDVNSGVVWESGRTPTRAVTWVYVLTLVNVFGNGLVMAYQLIYLTDVLHIELGHAGLIMGLMGIMSLIAAPLTGTLTDRLAPISVLFLGLVFGACGYVMLAGARTPTQATVAAVLIGFGMGWSWPVSSTIIASLTTPSTRSRAFALHRIAINAAIGFGGLVGGFIANERRPETFRWLFVGNVATFGLAMIIATGLRKTLRSRTTKRSPGADKTTYRAVIRDRVFVSSLVYDVATGLTFGFAFDLLPKALKLVSVENRWIGLIFAVNTTAIVVLQLPIVGIIRGRRRVRALQLQLAMFTLGYGAVWYGSSLSHNAVVLLAFLAGIAFAIGECMMGAVRSAMVVDMAPEPLVGRYNALSSTLFQAGMAMSRPIGAIALKQGPGSLWALAVVVAFMGIAHLQRFERRLSPAVRIVPVEVYP
jgi:MFS family permease